MGQKVQNVCNRRHTEWSESMREKEREDLPASDMILGVMDKMLHFDLKLPTLRGGSGNPLHQESMGDL